MATFCHVSVLLITAVVLSLVLEISSGDPSNPPDVPSTSISLQPVESEVSQPIEQVRHERPMDNFGTFARRLEDNQDTLAVPDETQPSPPYHIISDDPYGRPIGNFGRPARRISLNTYTLDVPDGTFESHLDDNQDTLAVPDETQPSPPYHIISDDPYGRPIGNFGRPARRISLNTYTLDVPDEPLPSPTPPVSSNDQIHSGYQGFRHYIQTLRAYEAPNTDLVLAQPATTDIGYVHPPSTNAYGGHASYGHHDNFSSYVHPSQHDFVDDHASGSRNYIREGPSDGHDQGSEKHILRHQDGEEQVEQTKQKEDCDTSLSLGNIYGYDQLQEHGNIQDIDSDTSPNKKPRIDNDDGLNLKFNLV